MQQFERIGRFVEVRRGPRSVGGGLEWIGCTSMAAVDVTLALESHLTVLKFYLIQIIHFFSTSKKK